MMDRWEIFQRVAAWLRPSILKEAPAIPDGAFPWEIAVEAASHHMVTPALAWCLAGQDGIPGEVADYFDTILDLNRKRNRALLDELETVLGALNAAGIQPVLLKGAGLLAEDAYPDMGMRLLADLDILVPKAELQAASTALIRCGFGPPRTDQSTPQGHHHLPAQTNPATGITVELHWEPTEPPFRPIVDARNCLAGVPITFRSRQAILPGATDRIAHGIAHGQLSDRNHRRGVPELRQLLDIAILRAGHEAAVDWPELERRFRSAGFGKVLADTLTCAEFLLGQSLPPGLPRQDEAVGRMRRTIERTASAKAGRTLLWAVRDAVTALKADPRRLLTAIRRKRWRTVARTRKW